jgi:hypothetical protein
MNQFRRGNISSRLRHLSSLATQVKARRSIFNGNPIEVSSDDVAGALVNEISPDDVATSAIVDRAGSEQDAISKLAAYQDMGLMDRAAITKIPPLAVWNAHITVDPILSRILASQLNYKLEQSTLDQPQTGFVKSATPVANSGTVTLSLTAADLPANVGYKSVPFFRFSIVTASDNAAPGQNYTIKVVGKTADGTVIDSDLSQTVYSFQRIDASKAVVGIYIPFSVIATRALPVLPIFGTDGVTPETFDITLTGIGNAETLTVVVPGYATKELKEVSRMYNLPSGHIM